MSHQVSVPLVGDIYQCWITKSHLQDGPISLKSGVRVNIGDEDRIIAVLTIVALMKPILVWPPGLEALQHATKILAGILPLLVCHIGVFLRAQFHRSTQDHTTLLN